MIAESNSTSPLLSLAAIQAIIDRSPFNRWLGMTAESVDADKIVLRLRWREELISSPERQSTHGGVLATLIDGSCDYAIAARLGRPVPTIGLRTEYHQVATPGDLLAHARVVHMGSTIATADAIVTDMNGKLIASGSGQYLVRSSARRPPDEGAAVPTDGAPMDPRQMV